MKTKLFFLFLISQLGLGAQYYTVTFQLDMSDYTGSFTTPEVNGTFNGWCGATCHPMADPDGNNIWEVTVDSIQPGNIEYKYAHDDWAIQENLTSGTPCTVTAGSFVNRILNVTGDITLPTVCWASCNVCSGSPTTKNVTFKVDMSDYTASYTDVAVAGSFNNWCGTCNLLTDPDNNGIYEGIVNMPSTLNTFEFKYAVDNFTDDESLISGDPCTITASGFTNRVATVTGDTAFSPVCWGSCGPCSGTTTQGAITFKVDMSEYTGSYAEVNLNGTFNAWCGSCAIMTDADNDSVYEITITLPLGNIQYKFTVDGWAADEQLTSGDPCTFTDGAFVNREYDITGDVALPEVCWGSCNTCGSIGLTETWMDGLQFYPNPANDKVSIELPLALGTEYSLEVMSLDGKRIIIQEGSNNGEAIQISTIDLNEGIYILRMMTNNAIFSERLSIVHP